MGNIIWPSRFAAGGGGGSWTSVFSGTNTGSSGVTNLTMRQRIPASALTDLSGTQLRFSFLGTGGTGVNIDALYFGPAAAGTGLDFAATPTQVLFGGSGSGSIGAGGVIPLVSDGVVYAYNGTVDLMLAWHLAASPSSAQTICGGGTGFHAGFKSGNDASTVVASGYTDNGTNNWVKQVEALV